ncbi:MAG: hypothetical protein QE493_00120 [Verrucomicrobiae bacterium]|nr:hypothetical protein [Verrucomicrobiae bacterium]
MLTLQQLDRELKITWSLNSDASEDLIGFLKIDAIMNKELLKQCSLYFIGEKEISRQIWQALLSSLQQLLDSNVRLLFVCTSKKIEAKLLSYGFSLLGEVTLNPVAG